VSDRFVCSLSDSPVRLFWQPRVGVLLGYFHPSGSWLTGRRVTPDFDITLLGSGLIATYSGDARTSSDGWTLTSEPTI
jgi:hypothetical protein